MKNILFLTPFFSPNVGGAETFQDELIKELIKCHKVTVITFQPFTKKIEKEEFTHSLKIYRLSWWLKQSNAWQGTSLRNALSVIPQMAFKSFSLLVTNRFDVIHAQGLLSGFVAILLKKLFKTKVFITLLALYNFEDKSKEFNSFAKFILGNADMIFVEGKNGERDLRGLGFGLKAKQFHHWCDQDVFKPPQVRTNGKVRVLFVGRPTFEKGKHVIEDAERLLNNSHYEFIYVENIPHKELPSIYQMAHIVVVPSLYAEGYSRVVIESASCGCAVITSNKGSLPEMVSEFGYSIEPTALNFLEHIEIYKDDDNEISYQYARKNFSSKNAEDFLEEYR